MNMLDSITRFMIDEALSGRYMLMKKGFTSHAPWSSPVRTRLFVKE